jgi:hypothetical protein
MIRALEKGMNGETKSGQERQENGQYGARHDAICVCGHPLGEHTAARPYTCIAGDFHDVHCSCQKFKKARHAK